MAFLSRIEEIDLIVQSLEKRKNDIVGELAPYKGRILGSKKAKIASKLRTEYRTIEHAINSYCKEQDNIKWDNMFNGVTDKM